jgi:alkylation response protein AidB-like acyl-CoA dehydrogenase
LTERGAGSDAGSLQTTARWDGDNYIINGQKCFITNGKYAAVLTVFATLDPAKKTKGICAYIIPTEGTEGISITKEEDKMGQRAMSVAEITFENVAVPKENLLGEEGEGFKIAMITLDEGRINIATVGLGIARAALEEAIAYAKTRQQFNQPIGQFQAIHFMLADMQCAVEASRLLTWKAARMMDHHQRCTVEAATAKFFAADVAMKVTTDALQVHGGYGYMRDRLLEKFMRDAKLTQIYEGTNQINRIVAGTGIIRG